MKHLIFTLFLTISAISAIAVDFTVANVSYTTTDMPAGEVKVVTNWSYSGPTLTIPATVDNASVTYNVTAIDADAFNGMSDYTSIALPASLKTIGDRAFSNTSGMTTAFEIPASVTSIGQNAFKGSTALINVAVANANYSSVNGILYDKAQTTLIFCPKSVSGSVTLPVTVTTIGNEALYNCSLLTEVVLPATLTSIGEYSFYGCTLLGNLTLPTLLSSVGQYAFFQCKTFTNIVFPASVNSLGQYLFYQCTALESVNLPEGLTVLANRMFYGCTKLKTVNIPSTTTQLGDYFFYNCYALETVSLPASVTTLNARAFQNCTGLKSIYSYRTTPPTAGSNCFLSVPFATCTLYIPVGATAAYSANASWNAFITKSEMTATALTANKSAELPFTFNTANKQFTASEAMVVSVFSLNGTLVYNAQLNANESVSFANLSNGVYLVKSLVNNKPVSSKIVF